MSGPPPGPGGFRPPVGPPRRTGDVPEDTRPAQMAPSAYSTPSRGRYQEIAPAGSASGGPSSGYPSSSTEQTATDPAQHSPIGTPYRGTINLAVTRTTQGGSSAFKPDEKQGQYLEIIYPLGFMPEKRSNCEAYYNLNLRTVYKFFADPTPPLPQELARMKQKVDRAAREDLFLFGQSKMAMAAVKRMFPDLDSRVETFRILHDYFKRQITNLKNELMWQDVLLICLEWGRDYPDDFRMDPEKWAKVPENLTHTRHWIYRQFSEGVYKRVWRVVDPVLPWEGNFEAPSAGQSEKLSRYYGRTITAYLIMKIAPVALQEQKDNPNIKWAKRGSGWKENKSMRQDCLDFLSYVSTDKQFKNVERDSFTWRRFEDDVTSTPSSTEIPKRRIDQLRPTNPFMGDSPPPSPPSKVTQSPALRRHASPDPFRTGSPERAGPSTQPRRFSPLSQSTSAYDPSMSSAIPFQATGTSSRAPEINIDPALQTPRAPRQPASTPYLAQYSGQEYRQRYSQYPEQSSLSTMFNPPPAAYGALASQLGQSPSQSSQFGPIGQRPSEWTQTPALQPPGGTAPMRPGSSGSRADSPLSAGGTTSLAMRPGSTGSRGGSSTSERSQPQSSSSRPQSRYPPPGDDSGSRAQSRYPPPPGDDSGSRAQSRYPPPPGDDSGSRAQSRYPPPGDETSSSRAQSQYPPPGDETSSSRAQSQYPPPASQTGSIRQPRTRASSGRSSLMEPTQASLGRSTSTRQLRPRGEPPSDEPGSAHSTRSRKGKEKESSGGRGGGRIMGYDGAFEVTIDANNQTQLETQTLAATSSADDDSDGYVSPSERARNFIAHRRAGYH